MKIKFIDVDRTALFLQKQPLVGLKSVHRSQVVTFLGTKLDDIFEGEKKIREDNKNNPTKMMEELELYFNETLSLNDDNLFKPLQTVKQHIKDLVKEDSSVEFSQDEAHALYVLYTMFKLDEEESK